MIGAKIERKREGPQHQLYALGDLPCDMVEKTGMQNVQVVLSGETPGGEYKVASPDRRYGPGPGWFIPGDNYGNYYAQQEPPRRRRGLFGRWFQPDYGPQGYAGPPGYYPPRGYRGY